MTSDERTFERLSGRELAELRRKADLTQAQLAQAAGIGRHAVSYWELKERVDERVQASQRMLAVLGVRVARAAFGDIIVRAGAPARDGVLVPEWLQRALDRFDARQEARRSERASREAA